MLFLLACLVEPCNLTPAMASVAAAGTAPHAANVDAELLGIESAGTIPSEHHMAHLAMEAHVATADFVRIRHQNSSTYYRLTKP